MKIIIKLEVGASSLMVVDDEGVKEGGESFFLLWVGGG